ncbi:DUF2490 domain-containing protein [Spirosoma gilvum]
MGKRLIFRGLLVLSGWAISQKTWGQIGSETQGGQLASWVALGINQELGTRWVSVTNLGLGRHSGADDTQPVAYQGLKVISQEFVFKLTNRWKLALSGGYTNRSYYSTKLPAFRNEIRPAFRLYYTHYAGKLELIHQARQDFRWFYTPQYKQSWEVPFELRFRYMLQARMPLGRQKQNFLILSNEVLAAIDKQNLSNQEDGIPAFKPFLLTENRLAGYFRHQTRGALKLDIDVGFLYQNYRSEASSPFNTTMTMMIDLILRNPFQQRHLRHEGEVNPYEK